MAVTNEPPLGLQSRTLLQGQITYDQAKQREVNMIQELSYVDARHVFFAHLDRRRNSIRATVARHLGVPPADCTVANQEHWFHGSFNVCIEVEVKRGADVLIRFPLPYRIGEDVHPGNADEKVRSEVATYVWLQENCPDVPIPFLYGFGLSTGQTFTHHSYVNILSRGLQHWRMTHTKSKRLPLLSSYTRTHQSGLDVPYVLIEYIDPEQGEELSRTWPEGRSDLQRRSNLFCGLSKIMLSLARYPMPRIGSLTINDSGYVDLLNRPLTIAVQHSENDHMRFRIREEAEIDPHEQSTHVTVDSYVHDLLAIHGDRLDHQPNAVIGADDALSQANAVVVMRSVWTNFFRRRRGPFFLSLTDLNQGNIFVDEAWNITAIVDLEWSCSLPVEMLHPPHWLTNEALDDIHPQKYQVLHTEFMQIFREIERRQVTEREPASPLLHPIVEQGLERGTFWFSLALMRPPVLCAILYEKILPYFKKISGTSGGSAGFIATLFKLDTTAWLQRKLADKEAYDRDLERTFRS
ncbi:hypothetical protein ANO11243_097130 [Dothideomycetidae sp. 11243]|nr:hypothetical protein ANO11243_097130 [fungal sp. No.11243]